MLATSLRLDSTAEGSSPTCPPRLRLAKSPTLDPPLVDVNPQSTPRPPIAGLCSRQWNTGVTLAESSSRPHTEPGPIKPQPEHAHVSGAAGCCSAQVSRRQGECHFKKSGTSKSSLSSKVTVRGGRATATGTGTGS